MSNTARARVPTETIVSNVESAAPVTADRILVVDDEPNICRLLQRYLGRLGYEVEIAGSVPEALGFIAKTRYDLVLTDLRLPGPSGLELLVEVRAQSPGTRTILMSAHADVYAAAAAIDRGVDQLIVKPFELEDLRTRVSDSLAKRHADKAAEEEREKLETKLRQRDTESKIWILRAAHALAAAAYTSACALIRIVRVPGDCARTSTRSSSPDGPGSRRSVSTRS